MVSVIVVNTGSDRWPTDKWRTLRKIRQPRVDIFTCEHRHTQPVMRAGTGVYQLVIGRVELCLL